MADKKESPDKAEEKKPEVPLTPEQLVETKTALLTGLWGDDAAKVLDDPKAKEKANEKKDDKPKEERPRGEDGKSLPAKDETGSDKKVAEKAGDRNEASEKRAGADTDNPVPADGARKVIVKKKKTGKEAEPAKEDTAPPVDVEETVRRVLDETPRGVRVAPDGNKIDDSNTLDPQDREVLTVMAAMEKDPRHKGLSARTREFWKKEESYQTQWEQAEAKRAAEESRDPVEFDPDAPAHAKWYDRNEPKYDANEFENARRELIREDARREARDEARKAQAEDPDLKEWKRERAKAKHEPEVQQVVNHATVDLLAGIPEFEKVMDDGAGNLVLSADTEKRMADANPILFDAAQTESNRLSATLRELLYIARMPEDHPVDPSKPLEVDGVVIRPHADILDTFNELQNRVAAAPRAKQMLGSQVFITTEAKRQRTDDIIADEKLNLQQKRAAIARLNDTTWTIQPDDVREFLIVKSKRRIQAQAEKAKKWGITPKQDDGKNGETPTPEKAVSTPAKSAAPPSGATASPSDSTDNNKKTADQSASNVESVVAVMW